MTAIPKFYRIVNALISEIAKERDQDPEEFRESLLAKIKNGMDAPAPTQRKDLSPQSEVPNYE